MPLYNIKCTECNHEEEILSKISLNSDDRLECPKCLKKSSKIFWKQIPCKGNHPSFGLRNWKSGLSTSQQASALLERGRIDGKREI